MQHLSRRATLALLGAIAAAGKGSPAKADAAASVSIADLTTADGRVVQVTHWRPATVRGTILFSHGAFSAPWKYAPLIDPWVAAGFQVFAPLHVDSSDDPATKSFPGLTSWPARIEDMRALAARVAAPAWISAGHSYGALVALTLGGAAPMRPAGVTGPLGERRVSCAVAFSPPGPGMGMVAANSYATLAVPALIETGTADIPFGEHGAGKWREHLTAYETAAPGGDRYALVLNGANHYFGGLICRADVPGPKQTAQLRAAVQTSTLFLAGYGAGNAAAKRQLAARALATPPDGPGLYRR